VTSCAPSRASAGSTSTVKNRLATILANVAAGVISLDEDGRITTFNERAGEILNLPAADAVGRPLVEALEGGYLARQSFGGGSEPPTPAAQ
jgi:PAS domain-containing protein